MAAGDDAPFQSLLGHIHIHVKGRAAGFAQFEKNVIVRHAGEQACFVKFHIAGQAQVLLGSADPGRHPREAVAPRAADVDALAVLGGIKKKFRGRDEPGFTAKTVQKVKHFGDLFDRVGGTGLLAVTEGRVGDAHLLRRPGGQQHFVKRGAADTGVREKFAIELGLFRILQGQGAIAPAPVDNAAHGRPVCALRARLSGCCGRLFIAASAPRVQHCRAPAARGTCQAEKNEGKSGADAAPGRVGPQRRRSVRPRGVPYCRRATGRRSGAPLPLRSGHE